MLTLSNLAPQKGAKKKRKRVGRGPGSGRGKTSTRGHKGQKARSGGAKGAGFEGGQTPLYRRLPKRGFKNPFRVEYQVVNLDRIDKVFSEGETVDPESLLQKRLISKKNMPIKILGRGSVSKPLTVKVHAISKKAKSVIESAGGRVELISSKNKNIKEKVNA